MSARWKAWFAQPGSRRVLLVVGLLLVLPSVSAHFMFDDYLQALRRMPRSPLPEAPSTLFDLFTFGRPGEFNERLVDRGVLHPWWSDRNCLISFFRPLSALTHDIDWWLWPKSPAMAHAQTLAWYAVLLAVASRVYRTFVVPAWLAGVSFLFYVVDDTHADSVCWIANRHSIVGVVLGLSALLAHEHHRRNSGAKIGVALGPACLAVGLLASEAAVGACAYLFSYAAFIDRGSRRSRVVSILPYAAIVVIWRAAYHKLGYGALGSDVYVDPGRDPGAFLSRLPTALAVFLQGQLGFIPSDGWAWRGDAIGDHVVHFAYAFAALLAVALYPLVAHDRTARFWCASMLGALVPSAAGMPADRSLLFSGVAATALLAQLVALVSEPLPTLPKQRGWGALLVIVVGLLWVRRAVIAPFVLPLRSRAFEWVAQVIDRADQAVSRVPDVEHRTLIVVNPPMTAFVSYVTLIRAAMGEAVPMRVRWFGAATSEMTLTRSSERSMSVRLEGGFMKDLAERLYRSTRHPMKLAEKVVLSDMTATVTGLGADGNPAAAEFVFDEPLESPRYVWMRWDQHRCAPFSLPQIGETVRLPAIDVDKLVQGSF